MVGLVEVKGGGLGGRNVGMNGTGCFGSCWVLAAS